MKKLFYLGFCLVLAMGVGCAITDYELIVDNDQVKQGFSGIVNTNGKAHIRESSQIALIWADGTTDETLWFVDQKANGDQYLLTYNNWSVYNVDPTFHDDFYCNPDWQGCAAVTADNPYIGDVNIYDYKYNPSCKGARSVIYLTATTRYYGECGRARMSLGDRLSILNSGRLGTALGVEGLFFDLNHNNFSMVLDNKAGFSTTLPIYGDIQAFFGGAGNRVGYFNMSHPLLAASFRAYGQFLADHATQSTKVTAIYNGISLSGNIAGVNGLSNATNVNANVNSRW